MTLAEVIKATNDDRTLKGLRAANKINKIQQMGLAGCERL